MPFYWYFASIVSNLVVKFPKGKIDDALDVFACHGVGGMVTNWCICIQIS
jgi:Amt family ammonium transporter